MKDEKYHIKNFGLVFVSNFVILDHHPVIEMYRKEPNDSLPWSGWCFLTGEEKNEEDVDPYSVETLLVVDSSVEPYLNSPVGSRFRRTESGQFEAVSEDDE